MTRPRGDEPGGGDELGGVAEASGGGGAQREAGRRRSAVAALRRGRPAAFAVLREQVAAQTLAFDAQVRRSRAPARAPYIYMLYSTPQYTQ